MRYTQQTTRRRRRRSSHTNELGVPGRRGERRRFYFKAKPLADGVSVNKSATCSAAKINICVNKSHEGRQQQKKKKPERVGKAATDMARAGDGRWETWLAGVETFRQQLCGRKCLHYLFGSKHAHLDERMRQPNWTSEGERGQRGRGITVEITSETCQKAKTDVETSKCNSHTRQSQFQHRNQLQARSQNPTRFSISKTGRESVEALQHTIQLKTLFFPLSHSLFLSLAFPLGGKVTVTSQFLPFRRSCQLVSGHSRRVS